MAMTSGGISGPEVIGFLAAFLTTVAFLPQAVRTIRTQSTGDLSLPTYAMLVAGVTLWLAYGLWTWKGPIIVANGVTLPVLLVILGMILRDRAQRGRTRDEAKRTGPAQ